MFALRPICLIFLPFVTLLPGRALGYDTLSVTLERADSLFLTHNLLLLSQQYNIDAAEALIIQAKAYPNPVFYATINAIDPQNEKLFHVGPTGQKEFAIEQLLILGGKRKSNIELAKQNALIARAEFTELLRKLRLALHSSFYQTHKHKIILSGYDKQLGVLDLLIKSYEQQAAKGNLPIKDVIRLKTVRLRISNNRLTVIGDYLHEVRSLQTMLQVTDIPEPVIDEKTFDTFHSLPDLSPLLDSAMVNRPDFAIVSLGHTIASTELKLQKQLAVPDVIVNTGYDQQGGAFKNQLQLGVAIPLPLWNRNRGNIKAATFGQMIAEQTVARKRDEIYAEVLHAWVAMQGSIKEYESATRLYTKDFADVFEGINDNFRRRNISILEFVDFFEAYNESVADFQRIRTQLALSAEQINYATATPIYKP